MEVPDECSVLGGKVVNLYAVLLWRPVEMNVFSLRDIIFSDACLVFIVTGLICAAVRWFHMCRPYSEEEKYFYPARRMVTFFYAAIAVLEIPYMLCPLSDVVLRYSLTVGIVYYPWCFLQLFQRYFRKMKLDSASDRVLDAIMMSVLVLFLLAVAACPDWLNHNVLWVSSAGVLLSVIVSARLFKVLLWVYGRIDEYHLQNFSNDSDFPYKFAERVLWLPVFWVLLEWGGFMAGSRDVKAVSDILLSVVMVGFLCRILHPQRVLQVESGRDSVEHEDGEVFCMEDAVEAISEEERHDVQECPFDEEARRQVLEIILRRYKEQHLQKKDVLSEVDKGKIAPASRFIASVGYYNLINMFRLEYARQYAQANPSAKQATVAEASGFASGPSFSKAKKSVKSIDPEIVAGVRL